MKKIPTLFLRGEDHLVTPEVNLEAQWVIDGEGVATRKWDGTACMVEDGQLFKRYTWKVPDEKEAKFPPAGFIQTGEYIPERGKVEGWLPVGEGKFTCSEPCWLHVKETDQAQVKPEVIMRKRPPLKTGH